MNEIQGVEGVLAALPRTQALGDDAMMGAAGAAGVQPSSSFSQLVSEGVSKVNQQLLGSQQDLQTLAMGDAQNLHQIMIRLEESRLSFQLMMQVRNRLLESYQDIMKMQI